MNEEDLKEFCKIYKKMIAENEISMISAKERIIEHLEKAKEIFDLKELNLFPTKVRDGFVVYGGKDLKRTMIK